MEDRSLWYLWIIQYETLPRTKSATPSFANLSFGPSCPSVLSLIVSFGLFICCVQTLSLSANLFYASRIFHASFTQPRVSCVGVGVNQKVAGALKVPCKGATFATSSSQIARHTPTLRFQKSNWTIHLKRMLAERLPSSAQTREHNILKCFPVMFHALLPLRLPRFEPGG